MRMTKKNALIVGGSSGLGLEIAKLLHPEFDVIVTGRRDPQQEDIAFHKLELGNGDPKTLDDFVAKLPVIDTLIVAAGFYQENRLRDLSDADITQMVNVGLTAPMLLLQRVLKRQPKLPRLVIITSTSQFTPRLLEPAYTAVKAGVAMLAESLAEDPAIGKVLVAAPAGMNTRFWEHSPCPAGIMLDPAWVAGQIMEQLQLTTYYRNVRILRGPARVELFNERQAPTEQTQQIVAMLTDAGKI